MAHTQNPRRFYIDRAGDQPVVRSVPVRTAVAPPVSPATHQVAKSAEQPVIESRTHLDPRRVTRLMRSARRRPRPTQS